MNANGGQSLRAEGGMLIGETKLNGSEQQGTQWRPFLPFSTRAATNLFQTPEDRRTVLRFSESF